MSARTSTSSGDHIAAPQLHPAVLGRYGDREDTQRELRCLHLRDGSRLVVDWRIAGRADARLVGALAFDEPPENARLLAELYLTDASRGRCRALRRSDLSGISQQECDAAPTPSEPLRDAAGASYVLSALHCGKPYRELRWTRSVLGDTDAQPICLRDLIAARQAYEPARSLTASAVARHENDPNVSVCRLRAELQRIDSSRIVLNKRLREAVLQCVERGASLSEIASRCGRTKQHSDGSISGETSWLSRRIGALPEGGQTEPTQWVHSDVLALIARQGLDLCPAEVEAA